MTNTFTKISISIFYQNLGMAAKHKLHSSQNHPVLRKLNEMNVEISPHNLMYPVFIVLANFNCSAYHQINGSKISF